MFGRKKADLVSEETVTGAPGTTVVVDAQDLGDVVVDGGADLNGSLSETGSQSLDDNGSVSPIDVASDASDAVGAGLGASDLGGSDLGGSDLSGAFESAEVSEIDLSDVDLGGGGGLDPAGFGGILEADSPEVEGPSVAAVLVDSSAAGGKSRRAFLQRVGPAAAAAREKAEAAKSKAGAAKSKAGAAKEKAGIAKEKAGVAKGKAAAAPHRLATAAGSAAESVTQPVERAKGALLGEVMPKVTGAYASVAAKTAATKHAVTDTATRVTDTAERVPAAMAVLKGEATAVRKPSKNTSWLVVLGVVAVAGIAAYVVARRRRHEDPWASAAPYTPPTTGTDTSSHDPVGDLASTGMANAAATTELGAAGAAGLGTGIAGAATALDDDETAGEAGSVSDGQVSDAGTTASDTGYADGGVEELQMRSFEGTSEASDSGGSVGSAFGASADASDIESGAGTAVHGAGDTWIEPTQTPGEGAPAIGQTQDGSDVSVNDMNRGDAL